MQAEGAGPTRYDVTYRTTIVYDDLVRASQNEVRACPLSDAYQRLLAYSLVTHPEARVRSHVDYWGTRVDSFGIREPHVSLSVEATASVETLPRPIVAVSPRRAALLDARFEDEHAELLAPSPHVAWDDEIAQTAHRIASTAGDDVVGSVLALHRFVHTTLRYQPGATYIGVPVGQVLAEGKGVCQDYAHLAIALCRAAGIPARYVSGYFFAASDETGADSDTDEVEVQTHAWMEAAIPGWGWLALDPTNAVQVGTRHITIGAGRDYDDVPPLRGTFSGGRTSATDAVVQMRRYLPGLRPSTLHQQPQQQQQGRVVARPPRAPRSLR